MTVHEMREHLIEIIKKNPVSLASLAREIGVSAKTLSAFLAGFGIPHFKSLIKIGNWIELKRIAQS